MPFLQDFGNCYYHPFTIWSVSDQALELILSIKEKDVITQMQKEEKNIFFKIDRMAHLYLKDYHDACDLTQEVFLELEKHRAKWESAKSKWAWAVGVFRRQLKRFRRGRHGSVSLQGCEEIADESSLEQQAILREEIEMILQATEEMNTDMAETLLLFLEGKTTREIAMIQGVAQGTVKWRIFEAKRYIARKFPKLL